LCGANSAWQRVRETCGTAICTGANVQIAPTGAASLWGEAPPRLEAGIWASIPSVRPPNPHLPASVRFTIRSPASSWKRISAPAPHSARWPRTLLARIRSAGFTARNLQFGDRSCSVFSSKWSRLLRAAPLSAPLRWLRRSRASDWTSVGLLRPRPLPKFLGTRWMTWPNTFKNCQRIPLSTGAPNHPTGSSSAMRCPKVCHDVWPALATSHRHDDVGPYGNGRFNRRGLCRKRLGGDPTPR
jgi:hypothetical protein